MIWCKSRVSKWFWKACSWSVKSINNLKRNGQKQFKKKSLTTFFVSREEGQLQGKTSVRKDFVIFKLLVVLSITKLDTHGITFSDICNFLVTEILICKMLLFCQVENICVFVFYLSCQTITVSSEMVFSSQGDYEINSYINWWKLLTFTWKKTSMKNVSAKVNLFNLRFS